MLLQRAALLNNKLYCSAKRFYKALQVQYLSAALRAAFSFITGPHGPVMCFYITCTAGV